MKKVKHSILTLLLLAIGISNLSAQNLNPALKDFEFLLGNFTIVTNMPNGKGGWIKMGTGDSEVSTILDGTFIVDQKKTKFGQNSLTTFTTIGIDPRTGEYRFIVLDKEWGTMDVYKGKKEGKSIIVNNVDSDARFTDQDGNKLAFQLAYHLVSSSQIDFVIHSSKDEGKTWEPYGKATYTRRPVIREISGN